MPKTQAVSSVAQKQTRTRDTREANIKKVRELMGLEKQEEFARRCDMSRGTMSRLLAGERMDLKMFQGIHKAFPAVPVEDLYLEDQDPDRLCHRISLEGQWGALAEAAEQTAILMGAAAMRTYSEESREAVGLGEGVRTLKAIRAHDDAEGAGQPRKNDTIEADLDATFAGLRIADLRIRPIAESLTCGVVYLTEEISKPEQVDAIAARLGELTRRLQPPSKFYSLPPNTMKVSIDELDGSKNHRRRFGGLFVSAMAILIDDQPRVSALMDPSNGVLYRAMLMGPYDRPDDQPIALSWQIGTGQIVDLAQRRPQGALGGQGIAVHLPRNDPNERRRMIARLDSLAEACDSLYILNSGMVAMIAVARGDLAAFATPSSELHDIAAAAVLCQACGCLVTDWEGQSIKYGSATRTSLLVAPPAYHARILEILRTST